MKLSQSQPRQCSAIIRKMDNTPGITGAHWGLGGSQMQLLWARVSLALQYFTGHL